MKKGPDFCVYALYKGDTFIDMGTKQELAERHNYTKEYIGYLTTPTWKRKRKETSLIAVKVGKITDNLEGDEE